MGNKEHAVDISRSSARTSLSSAHNPRLPCSFPNFLAVWPSVLLVLCEGRRRSAPAVREPGFLLSAPCSIRACQSSAGEQSSRSLWSEGGCCSFPRILAQYSPRSNTRPPRSRRCHPGLRSLSADEVRPRSYQRGLLAAPLLQLLGDSDSGPHPRSRSPARHWRVVALWQRLHSLPTPSAPFSPPSTAEPAPSCSDPLQSPRSPSHFRVAGLLAADFSSPILHAFKISDDAPQRSPRE